jgi:hypothetical protein
MNRIKTYTSKYQKFRIRQFAKKYNKQALTKKYQYQKRPQLMLINHGLYEYGYFNFTFLANMLSSLIEVLFRGYIPVIKLDERHEGWSDWNTFFQQPFSDESTSTIISFNKKEGLLSLAFETPFHPENLKLWQKIYADFAILNSKTQEYVDNEYTTLLNGKKVLGVLVRGTDYIQKKPYGHPIQPPVEDIIALSKQKMADLGLDYIYLATEEYRIVEQFEKVFPGKIIVNNRVYYDKLYYSNKFDEIYQVQFDRENDIYLKGLEYLSSIWLLSRCDALIGGNCGGSSSALYLNNGKYIYWHLFNLGLYGNNLYNTNKTILKNGEQP